MSALPKQISGVISNSLRQFGMTIALVFLLLLFQVLTGGIELTPDNIINIVTENAYVLILAVGMALVIIAGHIDLSVGSVAAFVGIVVAGAVANHHVPWPLAVVAGLLLGLVIGAWQGFWVAIVGVPAFIVTLAGMLIFRGLNQIVGQSATLTVPNGIVFLGNGYLPDVGPDTGFNNLTVLLGLAGVVVLIVLEVRARRNAVRLGAPLRPLWASVMKVVLLCVATMVATYLFASGPIGKSFPIPGIILLVLVIAYGFLAAKTPLGRHIYAVGGNRAAAELTGVNVRRIDFFVMMNMGLIAAVAAIVFVGHAGASGPADGTGWELDAIAAVFIGGAAVSGGIGTVVNSVVGGLVIAVLNKGLQLQGVEVSTTAVIKGLVLLGAVALDVYNKAQGRPSIIGLLLNGLRRSTGTGVPGEVDPRLSSPAEPPSSGTERPSSSRDDDADAAGHESRHASGTSALPAAAVPGTSLPGTSLPTASLPTTSAMTTER